MMKKLRRPVAFMAAVAMIFSMLYLPSNVNTDFGFGITVSAEENTSSQPAGEGSAKSPYLIGTAEELYWFAEQVNSGNTRINAVLTANITVNEGVLAANGELNSGSFRVWTPIGNSTNNYEGKFDGQGHTISGLYFNDTSTDYVGLFGYASGSYSGKISNVGVVDSYFNGYSYVGGVCGYNFSDGTITNCYNTGTVRGNYNTVGGVCGYQWYGTITNCYNTGTVRGNNNYVGGVCGSKENGAITNCYNIGSLSGTSTVGGVCGRIYNGGTITNCYNTGTVSGTKNVGGVCGLNEGSAITNCYYLDTCQAKGTTFTCAEGTGKTIAAFNSGEVAYLLAQGENGSVWGQDLSTSGSYPVLDSTKTVYPTNGCTGYANKENHEKKHSYVNGFCTTCGTYEPATDSDSDGYYEISNAGQLYWFAGQVNSESTGINAVLTADITVNTGVLSADGTLNSERSGSFRVWTPIGNDSHNYEGKFDGQGHTISGLYFNDASTSYVGLFGNVKDGSISNVGVVDSYFSGKQSVGVVCGINWYGTIENCHNTGTVNGSDFVGGVCGKNWGTIKNCYNIGRVIGQPAAAGGVCGSNSYGTIENCYNTGTVNGSRNVGGVCGENDGTIKNCHNTGTVNGPAFVGGVCGLNNKGTITNCYYLDTCQAEGTTFTCAEGTSKTIAQFNSGEVAYLLQGEQAEAIWGQDLSIADSYPVLGGATVYQITVYPGCETNPGDPTICYANREGDVYSEHNYVNGFCTICGTYEPASYNDTANRYEISNAGQLYWFAEQVNSGNKRINAVLTANITVNKGVLAVNGELNSGSFRVWTPIGNNSNRYTGTFDGQGFTVSGLYFNNPDTWYVGLFGYAYGGSISNVGVVDSYFNGHTYVGGVCGYNNFSGTIENCYNTGTVKGSSTVGGVCGYKYNGEIVNCYNTGSVSGNRHVGGVCGYNSGGTIENCYNSGTVSGGSENAGGVCGYNKNNENKNGAITNCYNTGTVSGTKNVGGVCGSNEGGAITNCYNIGSLSGTSTVGGVCGNNDQGTITNCYYLDTCQAEGTTFTCAEGTSKTIAQFNSGEVAYLLQGEQTEAIWGQDLSIADSYPVLDSTKKVYPTNGCTGYANEENHEKKHSYVNGFCTACGTYEPATDSDNDGYYEISNAGQLYWFAGQVNSGSTGINAVLTANITVNKGVLAANGELNSGSFRVWTPIGNDSKQYTGTFDGRGYTISGLYFNTSTSYVGLFGYVYGGSISNVGVVDSYFNGSTYVGGVCGYRFLGTITNCSNAGTVNGLHFVGGVCGYNSEGTITNCSNTGTVNGSDYVGGVCGKDDPGTITNCSNTGTVNGSENVGGVCGYIFNIEGTITNCYNIGSVSGTTNVGGVCGFVDYYSIIKNCYNTGTVSGASNVGGVCGYNRQGAITNCYYLDTCQAEGTTFTCAEGTSKTIAAFNSGEVAYFLAQGENGSVWGQQIGTDAYPVLDSTKKVYPTIGCTGYANDENYVKDHNYDHGFCTICGTYEPAIDSDNDGYYEISNVGQLYWFAEQVNSGKTGINAVLTANITVNTGDVANCDGVKADGWIDWTPIGNKSNKYTGTFDGQGYTISGLYFNATSTTNVGLFGYVYGGSISNVGVVGSYFNGYFYVGGVCGHNEGGTITNCYNTGSVSGNQNVGGVCGLNKGTITNCYNIGSVSGSTNVGGVCGANPYGTITNCYNTGTVSGGSNVYGVCGANSGTITNCYYLAESETDAINGTTFKTTADFNSGEVAYLLQGEQTAAIWGQTLTGENKQDFPVLGGAKVYKTTPCVSYSNNNVTVKEHTGDEVDCICDVCNERVAYIIALDSQPMDENISVAKLEGGGRINVGASTNIVAPAVPGYTFLGWYNGETLVSANLSFEYTPTEDVTLTATYQMNRIVSVTIDGGTSYTISINGGTPDALATRTTVDYAVGTVLTVTATAPDFAYWQNEAGTVLSRSASYTFTVVNGATVTAVYNTKVDSKAIVNFISGYDQIINRYQITAEGKFTVPAAPTKTGCDFAGWSINGGEAVTEHVADAVKAAITAALATDDTLDDVINVKATYTAKVQNVTVTVTNGTGAGTYNVNDVVTVTANDPESGYKFSHWTNGTSILSYNTSYSFYAAKDIALTAVYVEEATEVEAKGITEIVDVIKDTVNGKISFVSMSTVPEGCTITKAGVIATSDATVGTSGDGFNDTTADKVLGDSSSETSYRFTFTITTQKTYYVRAYLVYTDKNGNSHTIYGDMVSANVNE